MLKFKLRVVVVILRSLLFFLIYRVLFVFRFCFYVVLGVDIIVIILYLLLFLVCKCFVINWYLVSLGFVCVIEILKEDGLENGKYGDL